ncbi:hypothetical protein DQ04_03661050 [Trypanosoma grayi]|uniref:hypothetical protein n=1 Tax=Trypanosoma grayi TaxID=71804 RepID=UPI0004F4610C|nr:hypothetical protein DQ04_03661050 [Trypanosoma grayi]KEG10484.1 hypothetical protein DQ04_03661050 [Trypanosoma grayi]
MCVVALAILTGVLQLLVGHVECAFYMVRGGCIDDPGRWTTRIDSGAENEAVVSFLHTQREPYAGIGGHVRGRKVYWDDGFPMKWKPSGFVPPPTLRDGFLVVRYDGSWGAMSYDLFPSTLFICTDGDVPAVAPNTTETPTDTPYPNTTETPTDTPYPNTTETPTDTSYPTTTETPTDTPYPNTTETPTDTPYPNTTEIPTGTSAPITTEAPTEAPSSTNVWGVLDDLAVAVSKVGTFDIVLSTTNGVDVPLKATGLLERIDALRRNHHHFVGVAFMEKADAIAPRDVATLTLVAGSTLQFIVPLSLMESGVTRYFVCVVAVNTSAVPIYRQTNATLAIHSLDEVLHNVKDSVVLNEEDMLKPKDVIRPLRVTGRGTIAQHTAEVTPFVLNGLSFSMVSNGVVGRKCVPSKLSVDFVFANGSFWLFLPKEHIARVKTGHKSLCASMNGKNSIIALIEERRISFSTSNTTYTYGEPIRAVVLGASASAFAANTYAAFLSRSERCPSVDDDASVKLELEVPVLPTRLSISSSLSFLEQEQERTPTVYFSTASRDPKMRYLCVQHVATATKFRVLSLDGAVVRVLGHKPSLPPSGKMSLFNGITGSIALGSFVLPPRSAEDIEHFNTVSLLIMQNALRLRFVPLSPNAEWEKKMVECSLNETKSEGDFDVNAGSVQINRALWFSHSSGVLCTGSKYLRIDYVVHEPLEWLQLFGGSSSVVGTAIIASLPSTAVRLDLTNSDPSANYAVRLSVDEKCRTGFTAGVWQTPCGITAVSFHKAVSGTFTLCVGIYAGAGAASTTAFVATNRTVIVTPYEAGMDAWEREQGLTSGAWELCGSSSLCGYVPTQPFLEVCGIQPVDRPWPAIITERLLSFDAINVKLSGDNKSYMATVIAGRVFLRRGNIACQAPKMMEMSVDGKMYSTSAITDRERSVVTLKSSTQLAGVIFGLALWDEGCDAASIRQKVLVSTMTPFLFSASVFDLAPLLWNGSDNYYVVCVLQTMTWSAVPQAYIHTMTSNAGTNVVTAEAIATSNPKENEKTIHIWQTETSTWTIVGHFLPDVVVSLALVWDDPTCSVQPAYTAAMQYLSPTTSSVAVEASFITAPLTPKSLLYSCYYTKSISPTPLSIEEFRKRRIAVLELSLSSINYLPHYAIRYDTRDNTTVFLTDPHKPPITQLELFLAHSPEDHDATANCSTTSQRHVASLMVHTDSFGLGWVRVVPGVPAMVSAAGRAAYLLICATASKSASLRFVPISAYLVINDIGTGTQVNPFSLDLSFLPLNDTNSVLGGDSCKEAVTRYVSAVTNQTADPKGILVTAKSNNNFGLFIEPDATVSSESAANQLRAVYTAMASGRGLPLRASSLNGATFILVSVEGVHLIDQSPYDGMPRVNVSTLNTVDSNVPGDLAKKVITIFCVVVAPVVVGFVVFSLQRTVPTLDRAKFGKVSGRTKASVAAFDFGDSPPPRKPESAEGGGHFATAVEDTAASPLYDSDDERPPPALGCTPPPPPPARNAALTVREGGSAVTGCKP